MTLPLILSGDMPGNKQKTPACSTATKQPVVTVKKTCCTVCRSITHLKLLHLMKKIIYVNVTLDYLFCILIK